MQDSIGMLNDLTKYTFNGPVTDYYKNGAVLAKGFYREGEKWGKWQFYHDNGQLESTGEFNGHNKIGKWQLWRKNGSKLCVTEHSVLEAKVLSYWDEEGVEQVKDGNGAYYDKLLDEDGITVMQLKGQYKNGFKEGLWTYSSLSGELRMVHEYKTGKRTKVEVYKEGEKQTGIFLVNDFEIEPNGYSYLKKVEGWFPNRKVFDTGYPLVASAIGYEVIKRTMRDNHKIISYYRIVDKFNTSADTIEYGKPYRADEMPAFPGGVEKMNKFLFKHLRTKGGSNIADLVVISFEVNIDGNLTNFQILKSGGPQKDDELLRVAKLMPKWIPGKNQNPKVPFKYVLPVRF
ncbi:energy transducer TonB [Pontibacter sp. MBLB2868]|uniref:energy transducer TonB n=1 Tax=Pontibacter sp. MBLB2868 TaxID=3451555 RepID=UPI003F75447B